MSKGRCAFRKIDVKRMLEAARMAGVKVGSIEVLPGKIILVPDHDGGPKQQNSNLDNWMAVHADTIKGS